MVTESSFSPESLGRIVARLARYAVRLLVRPATVRIGGQVLGIPAGTAGPVLHSLYAERYEWLERALLPTLLRPDDRVVELGAAIGLIGLVASRIVDPAQIILVEANRDLIPEIKGNFARNGITLPDLRHGVAGTSTGMVDFHVSSQFWASTTLPHAGQQHRVDQVEMIDTGAMLRDHKATVLICDIEGGELDLLPHLDLSGIRMVIAELHPYLIGPDGVARIVEAMDAAGLPVRHILQDEVYVFAA